MGVAKIPKSLALNPSLQGSDFPMKAIGEKAAVPFPTGRSFAMHEMAVVTSILDAVCERAQEEGASRIVSIDLRVGEMRDIHEPLLQKYFDYFSRGTLAEGVEVTMESVPLRFRCDQCGQVYGYDLDGDAMPRCPNHPHSGITVVSGTELSIEKIGVI